MSETEVSRVFASNLRRYMTVNNMSGRELAKRLGVGESSVSNWLHEINVPRTGVLQKLTEIFDCKPSDLLEDKQSEKPTAEGDELSPIKREAIRQIMEASEEETRFLMDIVKAYQKNKNPAGEGGAGD